MFNLNDGICTYCYSNTLTKVFNLISWHHFSQISDHPIQLY